LGKRRTGPSTKDPGAVSAVGRAGAARARACHYAIWSDLIGSRRAEECLRRRTLRFRRHWTHVGKFIDIGRTSGIPSTLDARRHFIDDRTASPRADTWSTASLRYCVGSISFCIFFLFSFHGACLTRRSCWTFLAFSCI
jgi:hypothetical protein